MKAPLTKEGLMKIIKDGARLHSTSDMGNYSPIEEKNFKDGAHFAIPLAIQMCLEKLRGLDIETGDWLEREFKKEGLL